jgi:hypothetical protein
MSIFGRTREAIPVIEPTAHDGFLSMNAWNPLTRSAQDFVFLDRDSCRARWERMAGAAPRFTVVPAGPGVGSHREAADSELGALDEAPTPPWTLDVFMAGSSASSGPAFTVTRYNDAGRPEHSVVAENRVDGRPFISQVTLSLYPDLSDKIERRYPPDIPLLSEHVTVNPNGTAVLRRTDRLRDESTTEYYRDVPVADFWLDPPVFGHWADLASVSAPLLPSAGTSEAG